MSGHTLTVAYHEDDDDYDLTINHGTDPCPSAWLTCVDCPEPPPEDVDQDLWYEEERHGVEHQVFMGMPCVETDRCYLVEVMDWHGIDDVPPTSGTYRLDYEGGDLDDSWLIVGDEVTP